MKLTAEQIQSNWLNHLAIVEKHISEPRRQQVLDMLTSLEEIAVLAPASSKSCFHNSFPGGYVDHVNRMVDTSIQLTKVWKGMGGSLNFTPEELVFSSLFCCLGKLGDIGIPNYIPQTNAWRKDNLGELYIQNPKLDYMLTQDRSLYILQKFGIAMTTNEYMAIRLYDGGYNEANKTYYNSYNDNEGIKSNMVHIINMSSYMTSKVEVDIEKCSIQK
jgi:hypothetical protein